MKEGVKKIFNGFLSLTLCSALTILVVRLFETLFLTYYNGALGQHLLNNILGGCFDIAYLALVSLVLFFPFYLFSKKTEKKTLLVFRVLYSIVALISMLLLGYFSQAGIPLDRVFFMYSMKEIMEIISSSQTTVWWMYLCIAFPPVFLFIISRKILKINKLYLTITAIVIIVCGALRLTCYDSTVNNRGYYEQSNKSCYFLKSLIQNWINALDNGVSAKKINKFRGYFPEDEFVSKDYPFLHKAKNEDVIGQYFDLGDEKPNIVMVVVEGLGRENSGKYSKYISTTPFLDSLAEHSLYWLNCMSTSQRTAGVLPALFGALPFGREGFMGYKLNAPSFNSLPKILAENDYDFAFYYGGNAEFDNMKDFVGLNGGTQGFAEKYADSDQRNEWGLYDKFLFSEAVKTIDFESDRPRLDVYLTLTSHMPWDYPNRDYYMDVYAKMESPEGKEHYYDALSTASYLYVDEALKQLITDYSNKPGFENTIFIITGDHNYYIYNYVLERYHVPLLIWSPMLKENKYFPAVVSHRDVAPTLLSMLSEKYDIETPDEVAWLNSSLDTASIFRSTTFSPQMDASRIVVNMIYRDNYVDNGNVYKIIYDDNQLKLANDNDKKDNVLDLFKLYKTLDKYVCDNDLLIKSQDRTPSSWIVVEEQDNTNDTLSTNGLYPLELVNMTLEERYKALKIDYNLDFIFNEKDVSEGLSMGLVTEILDTIGGLVYYGTNDIRVYDGIANKHYEFNETYKQSNYEFGDGYTMKVYLYNYNYVDFKITGMSKSVKVLY